MLPDMRARDLDTDVDKLLAKAELVSFKINIETHVCEHAIAGLLYL
jgi:hypothetical protein